MDSALLMDGTAVARRIVETAAADAAALTASTSVTPTLATVLVGADPAPASVTYVRMKQNRSAKAGIASRHGRPTWPPTRGRPTSSSRRSAGRAF